jgi:23S rRNA maturation mini-RNase III
MNELESLNKIPKEHYTEHHGKAILIRDLIKVLEEEAEEIERKQKAISKRKKKEKEDDL